MPPGGARLPSSRTASSADTVGFASALGTRKWPYGEPRTVGDVAGGGLNVGDCPYAVAALTEQATNGRQQRTASSGRCRRASISVVASQIGFSSGIGGRTCGRN